MDNKQSRGITEAHARDFHLPSQRKDESFYDFRHRIAGAIREKGSIIEAHEAQQDRRYDDPDAEGAVVDGVTGALSLALHGRQFSHKGENMVGDDIAAGAIHRYGKPPMSPDAALLMMELFGGR